MSPEKNVAVIFIFVDQTRRILLEKRPLTGSYAGEVIFPGGKVEGYELQDWEAALKREAKEEFGVIPIEFKPLLSEPLITESGRPIYPYVITRWEGNIPSKVLDKDSSELVWQDANTFTPIFESTRKLFTNLNRFLENYDSSKS